MTPFFRGRDTVMRSEVAAQHIVGVAPHGDDLFRQVVHSNNGGLADDDALSIQIHFEPGSPQVDSDIGSYHPYNHPLLSTNSQGRYSVLLYYILAPFFNRGNLSLRFVPHLCYTFS